MRRVLVGAIVLLLVPVFVRAEDSPPPPANPNDAIDTYRTGSRITAVCDNLCTASLTGKSPWLTMAVGGAYRYAMAEDHQRDNLGAFAQPIVFGPLLVLVLLVGFKDTLLSWLGWLKLPLNALAEVFHAVGGLAAYIYLGDVATLGPAPETLPTHFVGDPASGTAIPASDPVTSTLSFLLMAVVHTAVWIVFNSVEVAILISPFPFVDAVLKTFRTVLIGIISGAAALHPVFGFLLALPIIVGSLLMVPFAIRFTIVGWVMTKDVLKRMLGFRSPPDRVTAFAAWNLARAPIFAYGRVQSGSAGLEFVYRRLGFLWRKTVPIPSGNLVLGRGTIHPYLLNRTETGDATLLRFPPRFGGHDEALARQLGVTVIEDVSWSTSLKLTLRHIWDWVRGRRTAPA